MKEKNSIVHVIAVVIACLIFAIILAGLSKLVKAEKSHEVDVQELFNSPRPVSVEKVVYSNIDNVVSYPGEVKASQEANISFRVSGPLVEVSVLPGDIVKQGDLLMQIDPRDFQDNIRSLNARLSAASAHFKKAQKDFARAQQLFNQKVIPAADFDFAENALQVANANVSDLKSQLIIAEHSLKDTSLRSPFDGVITKVDADNHEMVRAGSVILSLHNIYTLEIDVNIPENDLIKQKLTLNDNATIVFPSFDQQSFNAKLVEWNSTADPVTRTYTLTFNMRAPSEIQVLPGMTAKVFWQRKKESENKLSIPVASIVSTLNDSSRVFVLNTETMKAEERTIVLGASVGSDRVEVINGLSLGEMIVLDGVEFVVQGMDLSIAAKDQRNFNKNFNI